MNRVLTAIGKKENFLRAQVESGAITPQRLAEIANGFDMDHDEWSMLQQLKSEAYENGFLTTDEAQTVYAYLGGVPATFNRQSLAVKVVLNQILKELIEKRIKGKMAPAPKPKPSAPNGQPLPKAVSSAKIDAKLRKKLPLKKVVPKIVTVSGKKLPTRKK